MSRLKKVVLITLIVLVSFQNVVFATQSEKMDVEVIKNELLDQTYEFMVRYSIPSMNKEDVFELQLPFPVNVDGGEYLEIQHLGNGLYRMVAKDDFINVVGKIGGKKTIVSSSELNPIVIDGRVVLDDFPEVDIDYDYDEPTGERDRIYKLGTQNGDVIEWEFVIGGDERGVMPTKVYDEIGSGHKLVEDSLEFYVLSNGEYDNRLVDMIVEDYQTGPDFIELQLNQISTGEMLMVKYQTQITDYSLGEYSNQLIVEDETKVSETVIIEDFSDIDGDKPTPEPEEPDKPEPEDPEKPPTLPQVGEGLLKIEYLMASLLGILLIITKNKKSIDI